MIKAIRTSLIVAVMLLLSLPFHSAQAEGSALSLEITASKPRYSSGEPVELRLTVTNHGPSPCRLSTLSDVTVKLLSVLHNTKRVSPTFGQGSYEDGVPTAVVRSLREVAPGASLPVTMAGTGTSDGHALLTSTSTPAGETLMSWWPVGADGRYDLVVAYSMPQIAQPGLCVGWTNFTTVSFVVGAPASRFPWFAIAIAVVAALVIAVAPIMLIRRRLDR